MKPLKWFKSSIAHSAQRYELFGGFFFCKPVIKCKKYEKEGTRNGSENKRNADIRFHEDSLHPA
ncbi:MAG: hypothetical protein K2L86_05860, partial [Lachnospiraceae bacterium]|nr:hypothetical protein [Lachnospiraceae bacterium]